MKLYGSALALLAIGSVLVAFAVLNAVALYLAGVPKATLNITVPMLTITARVSGVPDPYVLGVNVVRAVLLLAIGLTGAKLIDTGLAEWREKRREEALRRCYEVYGSRYQQY